MVYMEKHFEHSIETLWAESRKYRILRRLDDALFWILVVSIAAALLTDVE
jgi:hypothetical protein